MRSKKKALAVGLLVAGMMAAGLTLAASPAHAATTFTVNSKQGDEPDASSADGLCKTSSGECTLRAAIQQANFTPGADTINFNAPGGFVSLHPTTPMPAITDPVTIDGYSQPGTHPNTLTKGDDAVLAVDLLGENTSGGSGLDIRADNTVVRGLLIGEFKGRGIDISGSGNKIEGNFIGTSPVGVSDVGNGVQGVGITGGSNVNTIGGDSPAARNVISANDGEGVLISSSSNNKVLGNLIGIRKDGTALGNTRSGVEIIGGSNNTVGDGSSGGANIIAFNGTPNSGTGGVTIHESGQGGNANGNRVLSNSIFSNEGLGIGLNNSFFPKPNDPGDADAGPNNGQNFPELNFAVASGAQTFVSGTLESTPGKTFKVQVFSSLQKDPSGFGEGQTFLGEKEVTTDSNGKAPFLLAAPRPTLAGSFVTATATSASGDTSEFSEGKVASPLKKKKKHHKKH